MTENLPAVQEQKKSVAPVGETAVLLIGIVTTQALFNAPLVGALGALGWAAARTFGVGGKLAQRLAHSRSSHLRGFHNIGLQIADSVYNALGIEPESRAVVIQRTGTATPSTTPRPRRQKRQRRGTQRPLPQAPVREQKPPQTAVAPNTRLDPRSLEMLRRHRPDAYRAYMAQQRPSAAQPRAKTAVAPTPRVINQGELRLGVTSGNEWVTGNLADVETLGIFAKRGGGKSSLVDYLLYRLISTMPYSGAEGVRFIIIDPKKVDFTLYARLPHLAAPLVQEPGEFGKALGYAVEEMNRRARLFREFPDRKCSKVSRYHQLRRECGRTDLPELPQFVVIIDEAQEVARDHADVIETLVKTGRAFGVNVWLVTQRNSAATINNDIQSQLVTKYVAGGNDMARVGLGDAPKDVLGQVPAEPGNFALQYGDQWTPVYVPQVSDSDLEEVARRVSLPYPPRWPQNATGSEFEGGGEEETAVDDGIDGEEETAILFMLRQGAKANDICQVVRGRRADILDKIRHIKSQYGIE